MIRWNGIEIDRKNLAIRHGNEVLQFKMRTGTTRSILFETICHVILAGPITYTDLFDRLYGNDGDGGPLTRVLDVHICNQQKKLGRLGLQIGKGGPGYPRRLRMELMP
jgi:DNA-binding response OmpR family regulator